MRSMKMGCGIAGKPLQPGGLGLSAELDVTQPPSLGLQLVCVLVDQLDGTMEVSGDEGTAFTITFGRCRKASLSRLPGRFAGPDSPCHQHDGRKTCTQQYKRQPLRNVH